MSTLYLVIKYIHILAAMVAVGGNLTYGVWYARAGANPSQLSFALKGVKFIDDRIANPSYGLVLLTGLVMAIWQWHFFHFWIIAALVLWIVGVLVLGVAIYTPSLRNQIKLVDGGDVTSPAFERLNRMGIVLGIAIGVIVAVILVLMVFKPGP